MAERVWSGKDLVRRTNRRPAVLRHAEEISSCGASRCQTPHARMWCDTSRYEGPALSDRLLTYFWIVDDCMDGAWSDEDPALRREYVQAGTAIQTE